MSWFFALIKLLETKTAIDKSEELPSMLFKQGLKRRFATANIPTNWYGKKIAGLRTSTRTFQRIS